MKSIKIVHLLILWLVASVIGALLKILHYTVVISDIFLGLSFLFVIFLVIKIINNRS